MDKKMSLTIRSKMLISYMAVMFLLLMIGSVGIYYVGQVYNNGKTIYENDMKAVECLKSLSENIKELDKCTFHMVVDLDWQHDESCSRQVDNLIADNLALMNSYSELNISQAERTLYQEGRESVSCFHERIENLIAMKDGMDEAEILVTYQQEVLPAMNATSVLIDEAVNLAKTNADITTETNRAIYNKIIWIIFSFMLVAIVISIAISFNMSNHILSKLKSIQLMAKRVSEYNISDDIDLIENDEFGKTVEALNESQFMVRELIEKIIGESAIISDMGEEVSLAVRKSEQRIEQVNVGILEYEKLADEVEKQVKHIVEDRVLNDEEKDALDAIWKKLDETRVIREQTRKELSSIATYLEQIGITSDYQNEIASNHKDQVKKFKVKERED